MLDNSSKVSVVIPTYGRAHFIERAIESVLNQTYNNIEIIVVDDNGRGNKEQIKTQRIVLSFIHGDIKYVIHDTNQGGSVARNTAILKAQGEFIAFLDDDDFWLPEKIEKQLTVFQKSSNNRLGLVYCKMYSVLLDETKYKDINVKCLAGNVFAEMLAVNFVGTPVALVKRECFDKVGYFDIRLPNRQDHDMFLRVSQEYDFECVDEYLVAFTIHENRASRNYKKKKEGWDLFLLKWEKTINQYPQSKNRLYYALNLELGKLANSKGEYKDSISFLRKCFKFGKLNIKLLIFLVFSFLRIKFPLK